MVIDEFPKIQGVENSYNFINGLRGLLVNLTDVPSKINIGKQKKLYQEEILIWHQILALQEDEVKSKIKFTLSVFNYPASIAEVCNLFAAVRIILETKNRFQGKLNYSSKSINKA